MEIILMVIKIRTLPTIGNENQPEVLLHKVCPHAPGEHPNPGTSPPKSRDIPAIPCLKQQTGVPDVWVPAVMVMVMKIRNSGPQIKKKKQTVTNLAALLTAPKLQIAIATLFLRKGQIAGKFLKDRVFRSEFADSNCDC